MNITINTLTKSFGTQKIIDDVSLEVKDSHAFVIIGPSGGGKTTLLRIIAGLIPPDKGSISINGSAISFEPRKIREYRKRVGMVFQSYNLFPHLTALQNITLPLMKVYNMNKADAHERAFELLGRFQLAEHSYKRPHQLSGGQKQRIALSRGIAINPVFLALDEPTSALDPEFTVEVLEMIEELRRENVDLVLVTHHLGFAKKVADRICLLSKGKIAEHGDPERIFTQPESQEMKSFLENAEKY